MRLMVFNEHGRTQPGNEVILVNPEIVEGSLVKMVDEEGCLSFPAIYGNVEVSVQAGLAHFVSARTVPNAPHSWVIYSCMHG